MTHPNDDITTAATDAALAMYRLSDAAGPRGMKTPRESRINGLACAAAEILHIMEYEVRALRSERAGDRT